MRVDLRIESCLLRLGDSCLRSGRPARRAPRGRRGEGLGLARAAYGRRYTNKVMDVVESNNDDLRSNHSTDLWNRYLQNIRYRISFPDVIH